MCVALREGRKYNAADLNTIKMDYMCVCVCRGICRSGNHHWALDIIGRITKCVLWASDWLVFSVCISVYLSFSLFFQRKNTDLPSINSLKMKQSLGREVVQVKM